MAKRRQGRMAKTQTVPVRLDPVLKWAAELAAAKERRSLNSFVEWAVEQAVKRVSIWQGIGGINDVLQDISAWEVANDCWHILPMKRLKQLNQQFPGTLTVKERAIMQAVVLLSSKYEDEWLDCDTHVWSMLEKFGAEEISLTELQASIGLYSATLDREERENERQIAESLADQKKSP